MEKCPKCKNPSWRIDQKKDGTIRYQCMKCQHEFEKKPGGEKTGTYVIGKKELMQMLETMLDDAEGEVFEQDFRDSCTEVADNYKHFTE